MLDPRELGDLPLCRGFSSGTLTDLTRHAVVRSFGRGRILWRAGDESRGLFILLEGEVKVVQGHGRRQTVIHRERPGGTLGDVPAIAGGGYPATAIAATPIRCAVLSPEALEQLTHGHPDLAWALLQRLAGRVRELVGRLERLALLDVRSRLAVFLTSRMDRAGSAIVSLGQTQTALAEELGTVREVVVKALRRLGRDRLIESLGGGRYRITDPDGLRRLDAGPAEKP